jgi:hypothetical protein
MLVGEEACRMWEALGYQIHHPCPLLSRWTLTLTLNVLHPDRAHECPGPAADLNVDYKTVPSSPLSSLISSYSTHSSLPFFPAYLFPGLSKNMPLLIRDKIILQHFIPQQLKSMKREYRKTEGKEPMRTHTTSWQRP